MSEITEGDTRRECCRSADNRETVETNSTPTGSLRKERCTVCGRNHYVAKGDPAQFGVIGSDV